jgi:hypothetical protein
VGRFDNKHFLLPLCAGNPMKCFDPEWHKHSENSWPDNYLPMDY